MAAGNRQYRSSVRFVDASNVVIEPRITTSVDQLEEQLIGMLDLSIVMQEQGKMEEYMVKVNSLVMQLEVARKYNY